MDAPVTYVPSFLHPREASEWFSTLWYDLAWERRDSVPRREFWTNDFERDYTYGRGRGIRTYSHRVDVTGGVERVHAVLLDRTGVWFEGCFLNGYEDGSDALGWHADDDPHIDHTRPIAVVTLYENPAARPRAIQFRKVINPGSEIERAEFGAPEELALEHGSLALMAAGMQQTHQHRIPKAGFVTSPRISLTFRGLIA